MEINKLSKAAGFHGLNRILILLLLVSNPVLKKSEQLKGNCQYNNNIITIIIIIIIIIMIMIMIMIMMMETLFVFEYSCKSLYV